MLPEDCALHIRDAEFSWKDSDCGIHGRKNKPSQEPGNSRKLSLNQKPDRCDPHGRKGVLSQEQERETGTTVQGTTLSLVDINIHVTKVCILHGSC